MSEEKRYTIHFSVVEVDAEGDTAEKEYAGVTLDWAITDPEQLESTMSYVFEIANDFMGTQHNFYSNVNITPRRPEVEGEVENAS